MSKKNPKKYKEKQKKQAERSKRHGEKIEKAVKDAYEQLLYYPGTLIEEKCSPDKNTVIFKGMTEQIARFLIKDDNDVVDFPLTDFYAEVPIPNSGILKIRWTPFNPEFDKFSVYQLARDNYKQLLREKFNGLSEKLLNASLNETIGFGNLSADCVLSTIYVSFEDVYSISFLITDGKTTSLYHDSWHISCLSLEETNPELFEKCSHYLGEGGRYAFAIQYIVSMYLNGEEIPKLPVNISGNRKPNPKPLPNDSSSNSRPHKPAEPTEPNCVAYIRYDALTGKVSISNSSREYSMKWWIVSGHRRHYADGRVVEIQPYIKGDKDDPQAQRALEEFKNGFRRIKYYHLVARKAK